MIREEVRRPPTPSTQPPPLKKSQTTEISIRGAVIALSQVQKSYPEIEKITGVKGPCAAGLVKHAKEKRAQIIASDPSAENLPLCAGCFTSPSWNEDGRPDKFSDEDRRVIIHHYNP